MLADVYKPELWSNFFTMVGGGVAALTGLVFVALSVALSLNVEDMTQDATHKFRSINTLAGLTTIFVNCGLVLMAGQDHEAVGLELFVLAFVGAVIFLYGFRQAFKLGSQPSKQRLVLGSSLYLAELIGALVLVSGAIWGLYVAATAIMMNVAFMISAAWLLVVGAYSAKVGDGAVVPGATGPSPAMTEQTLPAACGPAEDHRTDRSGHLREGEAHV